MNITATLYPNHPRSHKDVLYCIFRSLLISHSFLWHLPKLFALSCQRLEFFGIFRIPTAASMDSNILQTLSETTLCKLGWARKAFEIFPSRGIWWFSASRHQWPFFFASSCFVLSGNTLLAAAVNLCLIKKQRTTLNLAVYITGASQRGSLQTFVKAVVA